MRIKTDVNEFKQAMSSAVALSAFSKNTDESSTPCLLSADPDNGTILVEAAAYGLYLSYTLPGEIEEGGKVHFSSGPFSKCRGTGAYTIYTQRSKKGKKKDTQIIVQSKTARYSSSVLAKNVGFVESSRPDAAKAQPVARLELANFKDMIGTVSFRPGLKEESLRIQLKGRPRSTIEVSGLDSYSFARIKQKLTSIRVRKPFNGVMKTGILNNILKGMNGEETVTLKIVMSSEGASALYFTTDTFELYYPLLTTTFIDIDKTIGPFVDRQPVTCSFTAHKRDIQTAVSDTTAMFTGDTSAILNMQVSKKGVTVVAEDSKGKEGRSKLSVQEHHVYEGTKGSILAHQGYFSNFLALAPDMVPLKVESCGQAYVKITAMVKESTLIEYLVSKADPEARSSDAS